MSTPIVPQTGQQLSYDYSSYFLEKAKTHSSAHSFKNSMLSCGLSRAQGWRRYQEDATLCDFNLNSYRSDNRDYGSVFAIFDGHNGPEVSAYASNYLSKYMKGNERFDEPNITKCLEDSFLEFDESLTSSSAQEKLYHYRRSLMDKLVTRGEKPGYKSGCTCVLALVKESNLYVANLGDSRCVLSNKGKAIQLSNDHKPENRAEMKRITNAGGTVSNGRINGSLSVSRAFGDHDFKRNILLSSKDQMVSAFPEVRTYQLTPKLDEFMVLACDGIWNSMENQDVVDFVRTRIANRVPLPEICQQLNNNCISTVGPKVSLTGTDNMSCIVVKFDAIPQPKRKTVKANTGSSKQKKISRKSNPKITN